MLRNSVVLLFTILLLGSACKKKSEDTALPTVIERLEIAPSSAAILKDKTFQFNLKYFNSVGKEEVPPLGVKWTSSNESIAVVNPQGLVTGISPGQVEIKASYKDAVATGLISVALDDNQLSSLVISASSVQEIKLNESITLSAIGKNLSGSVISGLEINWSSKSPNIVSVNNSGVVNAKAYGTSIISASSGGLQSAPVMVQVIRTGTYVNKGSSGTAKLKIENNILKLETSADFRAPTSPPDLRMYLSNNSNNVNGGLELVTLNQRSGAQKWNVPTGVQISQYRYAVIWCKQYGVYYGSADLGN